MIKKTDVKSTSYIYEVGQEKNKDEIDQETNKVKNIKSVEFFDMHYELIWGISTECENQNQENHKQINLYLKSRFISQNLP